MDLESDLEAFAASLARLSLPAARLRVLEECQRIDQAMTRPREKRHAASRARDRYGTYRVRLSGLSSWLLDLTLPRGPLVEGDHPIYRRLAERWVRRGELKPSALAEFDRKE